MKIADLRVVLADIPVARPHKMSFTTLEAVNFAFVRIETADGLVGWGEAACLGGPTWSEESSESVAVTIERYIVPWLVGRDATLIEALNREMARRVQGNPFARAAVGFGGHGFQHSPATGRYVAEWLLDGKPSLDLSLFDPGRFTRPAR